jgi:acyl-homoserine lactone acylase PvdQ
VDVHGNYLSFGWDDSTAFRHARITERMNQALAAGGNVLTLADMESIQTDHVSRMGAAFYPHLAALPAGGAGLETARALLLAWKTGGFDCPSGLLGTDPELSPVDIDATVSANSTGCYLFHVFARELLTRVFADDLARAGLSVGPVQSVKAMLHMLENAGADQSFCNDVGPAGASTPVTCQVQVATALETAFGMLYAQLGPPSPGKWVWGRVHTFQPVSQFPLVTAGYEPGPFARPGGAFTVDVASPSLSSSGTSLAFRSSANARHVSVMDPAAPVVRMQLPGPEVSRPYGVTVGGPDLLDEWTRNIYFDFAHGDQILNSTVATQRFTP